MLRASRVQGYGGDGALRTAVRRPRCALCAAAVEREYRRGGVLSGRGDAAEEDGVGARVEAGWREKASWKRSVCSVGSVAILVGLVGLFGPLNMLAVHAGAKPEQLDQISVCGRNGRDAEDA